MTFLPETKKCRKCGKIKNKDEFHINARSPDGLTARCMHCCKQYQWKYNLQRIYGMDEARYKLMLESQNGVCAICKQSETVKQNKTLCRLSIDHHHATGKIRELLCFRCNTMVAYIENNPELLKEITRYLERNK